MKDCLKKTTRVDKTIIELEVPDAIFKAFYFNYYNNSLKEYEVRM